MKLYELLAMLYYAGCDFAIQIYVLYDMNDIFFGTPAARNDISVVIGDGDWKAPERWRGTTDVRRGASA